MGGLGGLTWDGVHLLENWREKLQNVIQAAQSLHNWTPPQWSDVASSDSTLKKKSAKRNMQVLKVAQFECFTTALPTQTDLVKSSLRFSKNNSLSSHFFLLLSSFMS